MKLLIKLIVVTAVIVCVSFGAFAYFALSLPIIHEEATFVVARGTPMIMIAEQLSRAGVIKNPIIFSIAARLLRYDRKVKAGEYIFDNGLSSLDILKKMVRGECKLYKITLIEGWNNDQMAEYLANQPFATEYFKDNFLAATGDKYFVNSLKIDNSTAEGYLFPNTYFIQRPQTGEWLVSYLAGEFFKNYTSEFEARAKELGMTTNQVVTLASIIEKEAGNDAERPLISSVFHNRLKENMLLQADPTVIYSMKAFDGNIRKSDLSIKNPYNTYINTGLPPGPIANPGVASLKAALWPAETGYFYFVAKGDGTHQFSKTLAEHNMAVAKYQLNKK
ncbi:MAG: aminodeoxychorismate lyase [Deltaproteobacteria bacterium CG11_big_fil_rev_8_21_14_0_20_49_13]|nr:MAG: aminodeoxychorismate lyase [Deltaproteobacteria bacterium CG11_big_fil_rev_8_21_14_0_20_49_13]